ncbi:unnamed protein product [Brassica oleracea]
MNHKRLCERSYLINSGTKGFLCLTSHRITKQSLQTSFRHEIRENTNLPLTS